MITACVYTNAETAATYNLNDDIAPFTNLDVQVTQRTDFSRNKMEQHGIWPTFTYRGQMELNIEGDLIANDASDYVAKRLALALALFGDPNDGTSGMHPTVRNNGSLVITLSGMTEDLGCDVTISAFSAPNVGGYPGYSKYLLTFVSTDPWFVGQTTSDKYYWS